MNTILNWQITPGSMGVVSIAIKCLGADNVNPGGWGTPVYVKATQPDVEALVTLLQEKGDQCTPPVMFTAQLTA